MSKVFDQGWIPEDSPLPPFRTFSNALLTNEDDRAMLKTGAKFRHYVSKKHGPLKVPVYNQWSFDVEHAMNNSINPTYYHYCLERHVGMPDRGTLIDRTRCHACGTIMTDEERDFLNFCILGYKRNAT